MAQDGKDNRFPQPAAVTALKYESGVGHGPHKIMMERTFSQDIQEGTQELKEAAEQTRNIILDLGLDGIIRWVSPSWTDVVGTALESVKGQSISKFIKDDPDIFTEAIAALAANDSKSRFIRFAVEAPRSSDLGPMFDAQTISPLTEIINPIDGAEQKQVLELEGQGIMVYDRTTGGQSHTMWMLQPATEPVQITIALPKSLVDKLGVGAEVLAKYLTELAEVGASDPGHHPPPMPIVCRVCERSIFPWWFEKHSDLCVQEHKAEMDIQMIQESLTEHRHAIVKVLDAFEARVGRVGLVENGPAVVAEYKGLPIGPSPTASSNVSSKQGSQAASPNRSRSPSTSSRISNHSRARSSFIVRRPLVRVVELVLDLCDTALEISVPAIKDSKLDHDDDFRTQSPQSESRVSQVRQWQQPSALENEPGLSALSVDTERLAKAKVEAIRRHQEILWYSECIRQEYMTEVDDCINEALIKAERAHAGESLSSSESESELQMDDLEQETPLVEEPTPQALSFTSLPEVFNLEPEVSKVPSRPVLRSMASALRNPHELSVGCFEEGRPPSQAVSTGSSSPVECPTPKSYRSNLLPQPQPVSKRRSIYAEDAENSDGSLPSSSILSNGWRPESPASNSDQGLSRVSSTRDRRKHRSMHLHSLQSSSPHRQRSPGRYPPPPPSPLRLTKSRIPNPDMNANSPVVSPLLTMAEFTSSSPTLHHRRQSSIHSSDLRTPLSPRLNSISHPQARAQPPSIKDFEVVKPISKGAFGSVYLAKKKLTGEYFAIKVLRKSDMVAKNQVTNVKAERAIMMWQGESDFVAKLYWTFSSKEYLYLVMEYLNGGDCAALVKILGGLTEDWAKKYIAEVVLGIEHLHSRGIVHRDLKPDNLLIDSKGHLKLTDFGLSRMGLIGRQKRALKSPEEPAPDLLKQGPFTTTNLSNPPSRSASFDYHGANSPLNTPLMTPALAGGLDQPSYFSLNRESSLSRELSRRTSGYRSDSGSITSFDLHSVFKNMGLNDSGDLSQSSLHLRQAPIEEESSQGSASPDLFPLSQSMSNVSTSIPASQLLPLPTTLFEPEESNRRFVGTPDYLAPETISGTVQDEMCDWWSLGCILFEFLFGYPPFNADTTEQVFDNIVNRRIAWPDDEDIPCSDEAKDLINKLIQVDPAKRLGANADDKFGSGGQEIQSHPWFGDITWSTLLEDEAQFIPNPENPEDTEYFDSRGATLQSFPEEAEEMSPPVKTPGHVEYPDRPHDALFRARTTTISNKRGLMPLHIPPHVARDGRSRRLSEPVITDDFGNFTFKNLPVLEKANKDIVEKMRKEAMNAQARGYSNSQAASTATTPVVYSPAPSLDSSPLLPMNVKRALSVSKGHRPVSPSQLAIGVNSSPSRPSQPSSPLLVQFSTAQHHERRKTSGSSNVGSVQNSFFDLSRETSKDASTASSPMKRMSMIAVPPKTNGNAQPQQSLQAGFTGRTRSQTVGSHDSSDVSVPAQNFVPGHHKRRSQLFVRDISPSSSDNESVAQAKAMLKVQRKRQSARRMSQISLLNGPAYRPLDILICEDHPVSKMVMERLLEKLRCRSITATTGSDVLRIAVSQLQFDIIFMEYKLPLINGVDVARMIKDTKSANTNTPIVCITGYLKDLPEEHHFDSLMLKPPTVEKLTESLCKYCSWKPPPRDLKLAMPLPLSIPPPNLRTADFPVVQDSPSSVASSRAPTMPESSWKGSSREDSIGSSGFFSDLESLKNDDIPVIISRSGTDEWSRGGLGISDDNGHRVYGPNGMLHSNYMDAIHSNGVDDHQQHSQIVLGHAPRRQKSAEAIRSKREQLERSRSHGGGAEEGDDEDEEFGQFPSKSRSPPARPIRTASKLGHEMMRTNSRGSVISLHDDRPEPESLRRSLELLEERMEGLAIPEDYVLPAIPVQPRRFDYDVSPHTDPEREPARPVSRGHITPPVIFPLQPGATVKEVLMDDQTTPMPTRSIDIEDATPKPLTRRQ